MKWTISFYEPPFPTLLKMHSLGLDENYDVNSNSSSHSKLIPPPIAIRFLYGNNKGQPGCATVKGSFSKQFLQVLCMPDRPDLAISIPGPRGGPMLARSKLCVFSICVWYNAGGK